MINSREILPAAAEINNPILMKRFSLDHNVGSTARNSKDDVLPRLGDSIDGPVSEIAKKPSSGLRESERNSFMLSPIDRVN